MPPSLSSKRIALVLGGGGLKGFAHLGVLRALAERRIEPVVVAGTSIGALIAAAYASGQSLHVLTEKALSFRKRDLFRINHVGMVVDRMRSPAIYLEQPLRKLISDIIPDVHFDALPRRLLVNTLDLARGTQVVWGLRGLSDVSVVDAVYASCALPGFFPPGVVDGRVCVDGGVVDNLPVAIASRNVDAVIAVDVGSTRLLPVEDVATQGFASIYMRAATTMMHELQIQPLANWSGVPMLLIQPPVAHLDWFDTSQTPELIEMGYNTAIDALNSFPEGLSAATGIFPRRQYELSVNEEKCIGCGLCVALAPNIMGISRYAFPHQRYVDWSLADGEFIRQCPTGAISAVDITEPDPRAANDDSSDVPSVKETPTQASPKRDGQGQGVHDQADRPPRDRTNGARIERPRILR
jgi:NTE family protein